MKKVILIFALFLAMGCSSDDGESGTTEQCFRVVQINYTGSYIVLDINGQDQIYYVENVNNYRLNQRICNLNDII